MPDISMCKGGKCPKKDDCYRYTVQPSEVQSYFSMPPYCIILDEFNCDYYFPNNETKRKNKKVSAKTK